MSLIVEDGSIVSDANSYVSLTDCRDYATARSLSLPALDADLEPLLISAMDYLESKRGQYQGSKTSPLTQTLQWPRIDVQIDCVDFPSDAIPKELKDAQCRLACEQASGVVIMPTKTGPFVTEETVGPLTTKYDASQGSGTVPDMTVVDALLAPLFNPCGQSFGFRTVRV